jgi:beta-glucanase (GH16 family)
MPIMIAADRIRRAAFPAAILTFCALPLCCLGEPSDGCQVQESTTSPWQLVWADEFHQDGRPDPRQWNYETGFVRHQEEQWYQEENAWCEKGMLVIEARRDRKRNPNFDRRSGDWKTSREFASYTSASLRTEGLRSWQYGRFEMRGRIDCRSGLWPTFWTMGIDGEWPHCGEVDIMEFYRGTLLANVAWGTDRRWTPRWDSVKLPIEQFDQPDWSSRFHVWRMEWDERSIKLYVDDRLLNETDLTLTVNEDQAANNPFRQPHFILLNLAVGGANGGDPSQTEFPARFEVDYVRVYQRRK